MSLAALPSDGQTSIWSRVIHPEQGDLHPEAARYFLNLKFGPQDLARLHDLLLKNQAGQLNPQESAELQEMLLVSMQIELLRSKARLTLRDQHADS